MSKPQADKPSTASLTKLKQIDEICDRFEASWKAGEHADIESTLSRVESARRGELFRELLRIELDYLAAAGALPGASTYHQRFPDYRGAVDESFAAHCPTITADAGDQSATGTNIAARAVHEHGTVRLTLAEGTQVRSALSDAVYQYLRAWDESEVPPDLNTYLPVGPPAMRRLFLYEFMKVDMEQRRQRDQERSHVKTLDDYRSEFSDALGSQELPFDVVYEEYRIRQQAGEDVSLDEYIDRFPRHAVSLRRCAGASMSDMHSTMMVGHAAVSVDVDDQFEDFELIRNIGKGAFATVFLARQCSMDRRVALKVSAHGGHEPRMMAQLNHDNIVRVFDQRWLPDRRLRLLYMEYAPAGTLEPIATHVHNNQPEACNGDTLLEIIDATLHEHGESFGESSSREHIRQMSWPQVVCHLGAKLAGTLAYAHEKGVQHRDIKPANILIAADGSPKLADFNIAYGSQIEGATPAAYFGGSLAYMSPEQLEACNPQHERTPADLDGRSDIYALGAVLWELLTGRRPFADLEVDSDWLSTLDDFTAQRRSGLQINAKELGKFAPRRLCAILEKCLAPEADDRYDDADQLRRQLELQMDPKVQDLLDPPPRSWRNVVVQWPLLTLSLAVLIPNTLLSGTNLYYNISEIVRRMTKSEQRVFYGTVTGVNILAWGASTAICFYYLWPILVALKQVCRGDTLTPDQWRHVGPRALKLAHRVAIVVFLAWVGTGVIFPLLTDMQVADTEGNIDREFYVHFLISQSLHGLIVAALSFFFVTFLIVRAIYPRFIPENVDSRTAEKDLQETKRLVTWYSTVLGAAPLLAIFALAIIGSERDYFLLLAMLGALAFVVSLGLKPLIHADLDHLRPAVKPGSPLAGARS